MDEWKMWVDPHSGTHVRIDLSAAAKTKMHRDRLELLDRAGNLITEAFGDPEAPTEAGEKKRDALARFENALAKIATEEGTPMGEIAAEALSAAEDMRGDET